MAKNNITHGQESKIVQYIVENNVELSAANVFDVVLKVFKDDPILERDGQEERDITRSVARSVECDESTIKRINLKKEETQKKLEEEQRKKNIEKANIDSKPDINKLVDNLYKLNIVDGGSYEALICFLMQLKYTRNHEFENDDKTGVFFNGVARNGKSATAIAICAVETQYGNVFKAQSGKVLSSKHEEQVWKSHLNFFDEVKPSDLDRELLLTIINGGDVEIDPKNKKHYNYNVNTNNIFTSNDQIFFRQRRISVIKFGNRLNGRPMKNETLMQIITDIMDSLPDFSKYNEIYNKISINNEIRNNPLAAQDFITYIERKTEGDKEQWKSSSDNVISFTTSDIYSCIKGEYHKQVVSSERKESIQDFLQTNVKDGLLEVYEYSNCTTKHYIVTYGNYIKISKKFHTLNTKDEDNTKISQKDLLDLLSPYFTETQLVEDKIDTPAKKRSFEYHNYTDEELYGIMDSFEDKLKQFSQNNNKLSSEQINEIINDYVTPGLCRFHLKRIMEVFYNGIGHLTQDNIDHIKKRFKAFATDLSEKELQKELQKCDEFLKNVNLIGDKATDDISNNLPDVADYTSNQHFDKDSDKFLPETNKINKEEGKNDNQTAEVANDNLLAIDDMLDSDFPF